jgi:hypothetical protein
MQNNQYHSEPESVRAFYRDRTSHSPSPISLRKTISCPFSEVNEGFVPSRPEREGTDYRGSPILDSQNR